MKKTVKLFGIIALAAVIGFSLTGCPDVNNLIKTNLTGDITLSNNAPKVGDTITATYAPGNGSGVPTWQWYRVGTGDEILILGANSNAYIATADDVGNKLKVQLSYDERSSSLSKTTTNAVVAAPANGDPALSGTINISPNTGVTINTELTATYSGTETVSYQWYKDGTKITGATSGTFTPTEAGSYTVTVSAAGYQSKTGAVVDVTDPSLSTLTGTITISPNSGVVTGTELTATYSGSETVNYRWEKNGGTVGTNSNKFTPIEAGSYTVTVSAAGYNPKTSAAVTVNAAFNKTLTSITAVYESNNAIFPDTTLHTLKDDLTVTAAYSDSTTKTLESEDYTLSGTLAEGSSIITVNYTESGITKTTTFTVTVHATHVHAWGNWSQTTAPTCTEPGEETRNCTADPPHSETRTGAVALGHDFTGTWTQKTPPTCTAAEVEETTCTREGCEEKSTRTGAPIVPDAHDWNTAYTTISTVSATTDGVEAITCKHNPAHTKDEHITYATGTAGLEFELINDGGDNDGTYRVRKGTVYWDEVHIPAYHRPNVNSDYKPVTEIGSTSDEWYNGAFFNTRITSVTIPASVTSIGNGAFYIYSSTVDSLATVTFAENSQLKTIGTEAFYNCTSLTSVTIPAGVTSIGEKAFALCTSLASITIPAGVTSIGDTAFSNCTSLASVTIAEGVTTIGDNAFYNCTGLASVTIPSSVTSIGAYAFSGCTSLTEITIPASVTSISFGAFYDWTNAQTIYVNGYGSQTTADAAWGTNWRYSCNAVIVYGIMTEIKITQQPTLTIYLIGEQLDITGIVVTATYSSGKTAAVPVTAADITGFDSVTAGTKTLTVTYGGKTATFTVTVIVLANDVFVVTNTTEWNAAVTTISTGGNNQSYTIYVRGSFNVAGGAYSSTFGNVTGLTVTLKGNGTLSLSSGNFILSVRENQTLIIDSENLILQGRSNNSTALVYVSGSSASQLAKLELRNGTIRGNSSSSSNSAYTYGGGVFVSSYGTFTMTGGTIRENGSYLYGGGVYVSGSFTMSGGTISNNSIYVNSATTDNVPRGGGVYVSGSFTMSGGTISNNSISAIPHYNSPNNSAYTYGGGVYVNGTFTMNDGTISSNSSTASNQSTGSGSAYAGGGGVSVSSDGTFTMNGGTISNNTANARGAGVNGSVYAWGGGVYYGGNFTMNGGTISGNTASTTNGRNYIFAHGGGVYILNGYTLTMNGGTISGNTASINSTATNYGVSGGGVSGPLRIITGTVYGSGEGALSNTVVSSASNASGAAVDGTTQYGTFNGTTWVSNGSLSGTNNTIRVVNGNLQ
ncbi:MAG: leucine-rich repeat protein [Treponema sp.]|nr:leucine-rich repeat protein [Treponema sp.]